MHTKLRVLIKLGEHADDFGAEESGQPRPRLASGESDMMKLALAGGAAGDESVLPPPASPASRVGVGAGGRPDSGASGNAQFVNELRESDRAEPDAEETLKENGPVEAEAGLAVSLVQSAIAGALENMFAFGIGTLASAHTAPTGATHTDTDTDTDTQQPADTSVSAQSDSGGAAERAAPSSQSPPPAATRQNPQKLSEQSPSHLGVLREDEETDA